MDFGLAKTIDASALKKVTDANVDFAIGTPAYISPEQVRGESMDHRGDLYAVGVIAYELLAGQLPFPDRTRWDMPLAHATESPLPFSQLGVDEWVPDTVERLVMCCRSEDPADRPQSAHDLASEYEAACGGRLRDAAAGARSG